jgi:hypothetical protein
VTPPPTAGGSPGRAVGRPGGLRVRPGPARDRGSVTAETALALPSLVLVLALCVGVLAAGAAKVRCYDAARAAARELARDEDLATARRTALRLAPGARVQVTAEGDLVRVRVSDEVGLGVPGGGRLVALVVRGDAVARRENR